MLDVFLLAMKDGLQLQGVFFVHQTNRESTFVYRSFQVV